MYCLRAVNVKLGLYLSSPISSGDHLPDIVFDTVALLKTKMIFESEVQCSCFFPEENLSDLMDDDDIDGDFDDDVESGSGDVDNDESEIDSEGESQDEEEKPLGTRFVLHYLWKSLEVSIYHFP